jgi:DNA-binding GntR family transcriptional regulator
MERDIGKSASHRRLVGSSKHSIAMPQLRPIARDTIYEQVYRTLRDAFMTGQFRPGQRLTIRSVAESVGSSPMPVREALRRLAAEQAVIELPNGSIQVPPITAERVDELRMIRVALEGLATERAASHIGADDLAVMRRLYGEMTKAAQQGNLKRYLPLHQQFHFRIYASSGLANTVRIIESLWLQSGTILGHLLSRPDFLRTSEGLEPRLTLEKHIRIIAALERGDGMSARWIMEQDISEAADYVLSREFPAETVALRSSRGGARR